MKINILSLVSPLSGPPGGARRGAQVALLLLAGAQLESGCSTRSYTHYLVEPAPARSELLEDEEGTLLQPFTFGSTTALKVRWNDGQTLTEIELPLLASGQRIIIEHAEGVNGPERLPATGLVPPPPTLADQTLEAAYRSRGLPVREEAATISLGRARQLMEAALRESNHQLALEWCALVLARYPSHPEFLRAKGSLLYLVGEREKAIEIYEAAEEIESDPQVVQMLERLREEP